MLAIRVAINFKCIIIPVMLAIRVAINFKCIIIPVMLAIRVAINFNCIIVTRAQTDRETQKGFCVQQSHGARFVGPSFNY